MKKLWETHSYTILLLFALCFTAFFLGTESNVDQDEFLSVTIVSGDTVWELAQQYSDKSGLSKKQFINWVLTQNNINETQLIPGEEIMLPVKNHMGSKTELASATGE